MGGKNSKERSEEGREGEGAPSTPEEGPASHADHGGELEEREGEGELQERERKERVGDGLEEEEESGEKEGSEGRGKEGEKEGEVREKGEGVENRKEGEDREKEGGGAKEDKEDKEGKEGKEDEREREEGGQKGEREREEGTDEGPGEERERNGKDGGENDEVVCPAKDEGESLASSTISKAATSAGEASQHSGASIFALLVLLPLLLTLAAILAIILPGTPTTQWKIMPPLVQEHYGKGLTLKVAVDGIPLQVFLRSAGPKSGEVVLCLHGAGASSFLFRNVLQLLAKEGLRAIALDFPGTGLSDKPLVPEVYGTYQLSRVISQVMTSLQLPPVHLVLHDTAVFAGMSWASSNVDMLRSLTLLDSPMELPFDPAFPSWIVASPPLATIVTSFDWSMSLLFRTYCSRTMSAEVAASHAYLLTRNGGLKAVSMAVSQMNRSIAFAEGLYRDAVGILGQTDSQILWANSWSSLWKEEGEELLTRWPLATLHQHGGSRWSQEDVPEEISRLISAFVRSLPPTRWSPPAEEIPERIQRQFDAMRTQGHMHGGHSHGPGCSHSH